MSDSEGDFDTLAKVVFTNNGVEVIAEATGNGPIDSVKNALRKELGINTKILDYSEHALGEGSDAKAAAYIHILDLTTGKTAFGVGVSSNITRASIRAIFSALNRLREE
jgi:2-isopropylmalate synthase